MLSFQDYVKRFIIAALEHTSSTVARDVYVVSLYVEDIANRDPRSPQVEVGFNTETRVAETTPAPGQAPGWPIASSPEEARWNFAFWLQNGLGHLGDPDKDPEGAALGPKWIRKQGLWYTDEEHERDPDAVYDKEEEISKRFTDLLVECSLELHDQGVLRRIFGRQIPVLIHELGYHNGVADQCRRANPPGLADDFVGWIDGMYRRSERQP